MIEQGCESIQNKGNLALVAVQVVGLLRTSRRDAQRLGYAFPHLGPCIPGPGAAAGTDAHELPCVSGVYAQRWRDAGSGLRNVPAVSKAFA